MGVGDKTDSQRHCVYKAPKRCRLWAYHSSARLRTISHARTWVCMCVCACEREREGSEQERDLR